MAEQGRKRPIDGEDGSEPELKRLAPSVEGKDAVAMIRGILAEQIEMQKEFDDQYGALMDDLATLQTTVTTATSTMLREFDRQQAHIDRLAAAQEALVASAGRGKPKGSSARKEASPHGGAPRPVPLPPPEPSPPAAAPKTKPKASSAKGKGATKGPSSSQKAAAGGKGKAPAGKKPAAKPASAASGKSAKGTAKAKPASKVAKKKNRASEWTSEFLYFHQSEDAHIRKAIKLSLAEEEKRKKREEEERLEAEALSNSE